MPHALFSTKNHLTIEKKTGIIAKLPNKGL
jgi:hypothetical protein